MDQTAQGGALGPVELRQIGGFESELAARMRLRPKTRLGNVPQRGNAPVIFPDRDG